ncbi:MAG: hypothetical protein ACEQSX_02385 [Baekduiaceae bacterium]
MHPRSAAQRLLRPVIARLDTIGRDLGDARGAVRDLADQQAALTQTLAERDAHWEQRLTERTAELEARLDALVAEVGALTPEVHALRAAQAEGVAYLGRRLQDAEPPADA